MILDAATFGQVAAVDRIIAGVDGRGRCRGASRPSSSRRSSRRTRMCARPWRGRRGAARARGARRPRPPGGRGSRSRRRGDASVRDARGAADREGGAVRDVRRLRRHLGAPAGRAGPARARRHAVGRRSAGAASRRSCPWLPVVLALSANSPWYAGELTGMASNRAPVLAELPRAAAPPAFASYAEWEAWVERLVAARRDRGVHAHLVGRASASEARHARGARSRPADRRASLGRVRRAAAGAVRDGARRRAAARGTSRRPRTRRLRPEPLGGGAVRPARRSCCIPTAQRFLPASELGAELIELVRPAARALGGESLLDAHRPQCAARPTCSSRTSRPQDAAADVVRPLARVRRGGRQRNDPGQRASAASSA